MQNGWIKLHRQITNWEWYDDINTFRLFVHLLLTVNHENSTWHGMEILKGQRVVSLSKLATESGLSVQQARTAISNIKSTGEITYEPHRNFSIITINNYNEYQQINTQLNTESTSHQHATQQQYKKKEGKEVKKEEIISPNGDIASLEKQEDKKTYGNKEVNEMLLALKGRIGVSAFADSAIERNIAKHCVNLLEKIGKDEFVRRLDFLLNDNFHRKNCNRIQYVYNQIKGFIEPKKQVPATVII